MKIFLVEIPVVGFILMSISCRESQSLIIQKRGHTFVIYNKPQSIYYLNPSIQQNLNFKI